MESEDDTSDKRKDMSKVAENDWRRWKLHSKRVKKMKTTLETSEED